MNSKWYLTRDNNSWMVRREKDGKLHRLPVHRYKAIRHDLDALTAFVNVLNEREFKAQNLKDKLEVRYSFISPEMLEEYKAKRLMDVPSKDRVMTEMYYLKTHFLNFFINTLGLVDVVEWHKVHDSKWAEYLLSEACPKAASTKKDIIQSANRFISWLKGRRYFVIPGDLVFKPLSSSRLKEIDSERKLSGLARDRKCVTPGDWVRIKEALPASIKPQVLLSYYYGLRRAETMGLTVQDVYEKTLHIRRQLVTLTPEPKFRSPKAKSDRKCPHLHISCRECYELVKHITLIHPDTLGERWSNLMKQLGMDYDFHDLRHTFVTSVAKIPGMSLNELKGIAGHKDIRTTNKYLHNAKEDDKPFIPD